MGGFTNKILRCLMSEVWYDTPIFFCSWVNRGVYQYDIPIFEKSRSVQYSNFFAHG